MEKRILFFLLVLLFCKISQAQINALDSVSWNLQQCIDYAVANNITVKQSELNRNSAEVNYKQSKIALLPNLNANASQTMTNGASIDPITSTYVSQLIHSTSMGLNAQATLYGGSLLTNQMKQNKLLVQQSDLYVEEAKNNITLSITEAYLMALYYKEGIRITENNLSTSQKQEELTKSKYDIGLVAPKQLADIQSQTANYQYNLIAAQNTYTQQVFTLKQLLELEPTQYFDVRAEGISNDKNWLLPDKLETYQKALRNFPEVQAGNLELNISNFNLKMARAGYIPSLSMTGRLATGYTNTQEYSFSKQLNGNFNQQLALSLSIPIFDRNVTKAKIQNAKINIQKAQLSLSSTNKELFKKIETAWQNAFTNLSEMKAAQAASDAAKTAYDLAQRQFDLGGLSSTDLLVSQNTYISTQQKYLQTKYSGILYYLLLQFYQGNPIKL